MINFNKKDPVADVIRGIMEKELVGNQTKLDKNHNGKLDSQDFKMLRGQKKASEEVEELDELSKSTLGSYVKKASLNRSQLSYGSGLAASRGVTDTKGIEKDSQRAKGISKAVGRLSNEDVEQQDEAMSHQAKTTMKHIPNPSPALKKAAKDIKPGVAGYRDRVAMLKAGGVKEEAELEENAFDYKSPRQPEPNGGSGVKKGTRYGGSKQKEKPEQEEPKEKKEEVRFTLKVMKEKYEEPILDELINEVLSKDADAGDWIHDFVHSDNPKFEGKSKAERKKMALGAYYKKQNEEAVQEGLKSVAKKAFKALTGGSDEDQRKDLQRKMGVPQTGQKPTQKEDVTPPKHYGGKGTEGAKFDLYMQKRKEANAKTAPVTPAPKPTKEDVVMEGRSPVSSQGMDTPFVTDAENKPLANAKELAAKTMKRMKNEMLGKAGTSE